MNSLSGLESIWRDLCYGLRQLRLSPGFTAVAILSLALGIGANTAIFQLLDAVRLRSLPVPDPQELAEIRIEGGYPRIGVRTDRYAQLTLPIWQEIRDSRPEAFSDVFIWTRAGGRVGEGEEAHQVDGMLVSGNFFSVLGVPAWRGRVLTPADESPVCPSSTTVVSYSYWRDRLGGQEVDKMPLLHINGQPHRVVGVTPPEFFGLIVGEEFDVVIPFCPPSPVRRDLFQFSVMGRLSPGWTLQRATTELQALSPGIFQATEITGYNAESAARYRSFRLEAISGAAGVSLLRETYDASLLLLLGITGLVLLIACANLANLMLARAAAREREVAVRRALGASRARLVRQLLTESMLLAAAGTAAGVLIARGLSRALVNSLSTESSSIELTLGTDWRVLLFATGVACMTCIVFGVAPAWRAAQTEPQAAMSASGRSLTAGRERHTVQRLMVVTQVAVSLVLLAGALLFIRSFRNLTTFDAGMRQENVFVGFFGFNRAGLPQEQWLKHKRLLAQDVAAVPGVLAAATATNLPLLGGDWEHRTHAGETAASAKFTWVGPGYFDVMGIPILQGRAFEEGDTAESPRVAVVNEAFVDAFLADAQPIGETLRTDAEPGFPETVYEIVGVIPSTRYDNLRSGTPPMVFAPDEQVPNSGRPFAQMLIHVSGPATMEAVRRTFAETHPELDIDVFDFQARVREGLVRERMLAFLSGFFGLLAALLTMVGLYGLISYLAVRRRNEIGIRMALGAVRAQIVRMVLREALRLLAVGIAAGAAVSLIVGRSASALLFELEPSDPATLVASALLLSLTAVLAGLLPAWRAAKLDPVSALRQD